MNQKQQNTAALERISAQVTCGGGGGLNAFYWYQIFALDYVVVKAQIMLSSHGGFQAIANLESSIHCSSDQSK